MSDVTFLAIETFKVFRKRVVSGNTSEGDEITDTIAGKIIEKWFVPYESGDSTIGPEIDKIQYLDGLTDIQNSIAGGKPLMLTSETIDGQEKIVMYTVDPKLSSLTLVSPGTVVNPDITDDGNDLIHKLDGGVLADDASGTTWTTIVDDGEVSGPDAGSELLCPFLLFNRRHIS